MRVFRNETPEWNTVRAIVARFLSFQQLTLRQSSCTSKGMNLALIVLAAQLIVVVVAMFRESGEDERFAGDKLGFRS